MRTRIAILLLAAMLTGCGSELRTADEAAAGLLPERPMTAPRDETASWAKAIDVREFHFPEDHGSHEDFRIEWWYYTGNLFTDEGRRFGYQITFFRTGIQRDPQNPSAWVVRDLYTAHFALSDVANRKHYSAQQNRRAGVGLAGAATGRLEVWNGDWRTELRDGAHHVTAEDGAFAIDLTLLPGKGVILQGEDGLSQKGAAQGNASYYYSMPRMPTSGSITVDGETYVVTGESWMDHEFSTSFLEQGQRGWDWLSIQLDDDSELMLYQMRRSNGSTDPYSSGAHISGEGELTRLTREDFRLIPGRTWRSPNTGAEYPLEWRVEIKPLGLMLNISPAFDSQEMATEATTGIAYWEGAVDVTGSRRDAPVAGRGYLELTGYTETELGSMLKR